MVPDPKWLDFFKLPLKAVIAAALASGALLALVLLHILDLGPLGPIALTVLIILSVVSTTVAIVGCVDAMLAPFRAQRRHSLLEARRDVRRKELDERRAEATVAVLARLDHLSREEIAVVADALGKGSPSFYTYVHSPPVSMLQGKGLVWTPGGTHHQDYYPFSFHDHVWEALLDRKDEFLAKEAEHKRADEERKAAERRRRGY